ncbi:MAG: fibronectin type III-like domain-contianing protein [Flavobacteriales bacterium]|nr:fibronectin type III-like domain-contianing protein [Flavobacteriales bacterium]
MVDPNFGMNAVNPLFEFGSGLSYTTFTYSDLTLDKDAYSQNGTIKGSVTVMNTGSESGKEVVQVYVSDMVATITPSIKRLRYFEKVFIEAGGEKKIEFEIPVSDLAFVGRDLQWIVESGEFTLTINSLEQKFNVE